MKESIIHILSFMCLEIQGNETTNFNTKVPVSTYYVYKQCRWFLKDISLSGCANKACLTLPKYDKFFVWYMMPKLLWGGPSGRAVESAVS